MTTQKRTVRIYTDMDGTIARFYEHADCLERMYEPEYFIGLNAYANVIQGLRLLKQKLGEEVELFSLSAVFDAAKESICEGKRIWLENFFPEITSDRTIFSCCGQNKADAVVEICGEIRPCDILLDDYNRNLEEWKIAGGFPIKFVNEINDKGRVGPLWTGQRIRYDFSPQRICDEIEATINHLLN